MKKGSIILLLIVFFVIIITGASNAAGVCYTCHYSDFGFYICELSYSGYENCSIQAPDDCDLSGPGCLVQT
ncbi:MAG TPA: hypothetical protein ENN03_06450 [bacterium]|nr:hypothetical protein [bacterium]